MSLSGSMYTAANGLQAHGDALSTISDNIANISTVGFKESQVRFEDVIGSTIADAVSGTSVGQGSRIAGTDTNFAQGTLLPTGRSTDLAMQGSGFFIVNGAYQGTPGNYFTRDGSFHVDTGGYLVNGQGLRVQGYAVSNEGVMLTQVSDLKVGTTALQPPVATTEATLKANINSESTETPTFNVADPESTSNFGTSVTVYDSRGAARNVDLYFVNQGSSNYKWYAVCKGDELQGGTAGANTQVGTGALSFDTDGRLVTPSSAAMTINFDNADANQKITLSFGDATNDGGTGRQGLTSYAGPSNITYINQDGFAEGALAGVSVSDDGVITGTFTNGVSRDVGMLAVASFVSQEGLGRVGGTLYAASAESGLPAIGPAGVGGRGNIVAGSLEQSNVNLSQEFINMMSYQRGFEANTRTVKVSDSMMQELVNLGR